MTTDEPPPIDPTAIAHLQAAAAGMRPCPPWCVATHDNREPPGVRTHRSPTVEIGTTRVLVFVLQTDYDNGVVLPPYVDVFDAEHRAQDDTFPTARLAPAEAIAMAGMLDKLAGDFPTLHIDLADALRAAAALATGQKGDQ
ncbi:hypothetical protein ACGFJC_47735 [Nonomuraea fuscirosea]|uniref:hypothetical protein n=1 Tax=Nonomuraea fuscirosea TaxID=1291556 RepID=UPI00371C2796